MRKTIKIIVGSCLVSMLVQTLVGNAYAATTQETILLMRHGEKPEVGLGNIDCRGLNRALALSHVLLKTYGQPNYIFAPDPSTKIKDKGIQYNYVRPLATIEPTAVAANLPVNTPYGDTDDSEMATLLTSSAYANSLIFVAWEHLNLVKIARTIVTSFGGDAEEIPEWSGTDYDSIYKLVLTNTNGYKSVSFHHLIENLDNQSETCPQ